jgi:hypothetical protein
MSNTLMLALLTIGMAICVIGATIAYLAQKTDDAIFLAILANVLATLMLGRKS